MPRMYSLYLNDILTAIERIRNFTQEVQQSQFSTDRMRLDSVLYNLMIIGEAIKNIPDEVQTRHSEVRWHDISRFRDRIVHHYFTTDPGIVWEIIQIHLPILEDHVRSILIELADDETNDPPVVE